MLKKINANELINHVGENIEYAGFIDAIRDKKWVMFVILRDETGKVQLTIEKSEEKNKELLETFANLTPESTVKINCLVQKNDAVKLNGIELIPESVTVTSKSFNELPFNFNDLDGVNLDTRLDNRYIDLRNEKNMKTFMIQSSLVQYMREFLK